MSQKCCPLQPSINKLAENGRPREDRERNREGVRVGEKVINKSLISWVFSPPPSHWAVGEHTYTLTHTPTAACRSGCIILTAIWRRLICCLITPFVTHDDRSHPASQKRQRVRNRYTPEYFTNHHLKSENHALNFSICSSRKCI